MTPEFENILTLLILAFIAFLWIKSFKIAFKKPFIFGFIEEGFNYLINWSIMSNRSNIQKLLEWIKKPIFGCVFCMASVHGLSVFVLAKVVNLHSLPWFSIIIFLPVVMGITTLYYEDPFDVIIDEEDTSI